MNKLVPSLFLSLTVYFVSMSVEAQSQKMCPKYAKMIAAEPNAKIENKLMAEAKKAGWNIRTYPLDLILSAASGKMIAGRERIGETMSLVGFVASEPHDPYELFPDGPSSFTGNPMAVMRKEGRARELILSQYPELRGIEYPKFSDEAARLQFVSELEARFGSRLSVVQPRDP